jgi:hypothetical protein
VSKIGYFINILAWDRLPEETTKNGGGAVPMAGGFLSRKFEKVCVNICILEYKKRQAVFKTRLKILPVLTRGPRAILVSRILI